MNVVAKAAILTMEVKATSYWRGSSNIKNGNYKKLKNVLSPTDL